MDMEQNYVTAITTAILLHSETESTEQRHVHDQPFYADC